MCTHNLLFDIIKIKDYMKIHSLKMVSVNKVNVNDFDL